MTGLRFMRTFINESRRVDNLVGSSCRHTQCLRQLSSNTKKGYQSIGSFHSEDLATIMLKSDDEYVPPSIPFEIPSLPEGPDFMLDLNHWTFLNHGAFGAALTCGYYQAEAWRRYLERQPLRYHDRDLLPHLAHSTRCLAHFLSVDSRNLALLPNVTSGMNAILASYARYYGSSSHVILWDTSYGSVKKMAQRYLNNKVSEIPFQQKYLHQLATTDDPEHFLVDVLNNFLQNKNFDGKVPLLLLDHTTSNTALTFPVTKLAAAFKDHFGSDDAPVAVDGAHGLLAQKNVALDSIDFYVTNGHKWLSAPRGVAAMYATPFWQEQLQPAVISHGIDAPDFLSRFLWDGCRDYAAALSLPVVLEYWNRANPSRVRSVLKERLREGTQVLAQRWYGGDDRREGLTLAPLDSSLLSPMALVKLPMTGDKTPSDAKMLQDYLHTAMVEVPIKCINGSLYVRLSCHVYNKVQDFDVLAEAVRRCPF